MSETQSKSFNAFVVTVSDSRFRGVNVDTVGPQLARRLEDAGYQVAGISIVPDEREEISNTLISVIDEKKADLIVTTGGTGLSSRDVTPEATRDVITTEIPGFGECMRIDGSQKTRSAFLSRGTAGIRRESIIINVPGSERGAIQSLESLLPLIHHALEIIKGEAQECGKKIGEDD